MKWANHVVYSVSMKDEYINRQGILMPLETGLHFKTRGFSNILKMFSSHAQSSDNVVCVCLIFSFKNTYKASGFLKMSVMLPSERAPFFSTSRNLLFFIWLHLFVDL